MKALIFGKDGQLGRALAATTPTPVTATAVGRADCDHADPEQVRACIREHAPAVVLNAAAYTAVDRAESEREIAFAINAAAVDAIAGACAEQGAKFVHVSTDFVFNGDTRRPYRPHDRAEPLNVYGGSKLAGEQRIASVTGLDWRIVRTAWVYAASGHNFVLTMLKLFRERDQVRVVADQVGTPTSARSLAECVWQAALDEGEPAILHFTDAGVASWYDFAIAIYEEARGIGLIKNKVEIVPISTAEFPTVARRPAYSVLDKSETLKRLNLQPVHWRVRLREVPKEMRA